ncbi:hypothetical protein B0O99DRAFT_610366, partial [Bisporella sp. PMI_857]
QHQPQPENISSRPLTRDEVAEKELQSFLQEVSAESTPNSTKYSRKPKSAPPQPKTTSTAISPSQTTSNHEPLSERLLPTTMSCRDAFDAAFYCNSLGGQFNNLYRYGEARSCSEHWNDFWFCMRTRTWSAAEKAEAIRGRYREKERVKYGDVRGEDGKKVLGRSSEDVWKSREDMAWRFGTDEEWNRGIREYRRALQEQDPKGRLG